MVAGDIGTGLDFPVNCSVKYNKWMMAMTESGVTTFKLRPHVPSGVAKPVEYITLDCGAGSSRSISGRIQWISPAVRWGKTRYYSAQCVNGVKQGASDWATHDGYRLEYSSGALSATRYEGSQASTPFLVETSEKVYLVTAQAADAAEHDTNRLALSR